MSAEDIKPTDRSLSRGRDPVVSFGRGGFGNMRPSSTSRGPGSREMSLERGRGPNRIIPNDGIDAVPEDAVSHSRSPVRGGGLNNIADLGSPDIEIPIHVIHPDNERVSTGRGGAGNIRDRSQSKVRDQPEPHIKRPQAEEVFYSSGRGGAGNIRSTSRSKPSKEEEKAHDHKPHSVADVLHKIAHPYA